MKNDKQENSQQIKNQETVDEDFSGGNKSLNSHSVVFIWLLTVYPIIGTILAYNYALKDAGYGGMVLFPMAVGGLVCSFIINTVFTVESKDKEEPTPMYLLPKLSPVISGVILFMALLS
ncbi:hypothetical protein QNZ47_001761 [Enterobacter cloacae]|nr:hypothetical protein [Enterobacter cloacae]